MSIENVIRQCAPTMANIKTGSLFTTPFESKEKLKIELQEINLILEPKGLRLIPLRYTEKNICLLYMYRPSRLAYDLKEKDVQTILFQVGYTNINIADCLTQLIKRLQNNAEFPHEIGLFLSYPVLDVKGFIDNHAKNYKFSGLWKVYGDEKVAKNLFQKYKQCTDIYCNNYKLGTSFEKLIIAS